MTVILHLVILAVCVVALILIAVMMHARLVEKEIEFLKSDPDVKTVKKHRYNPLRESFALPSMAAYNALDLDDAAFEYVHGNRVKVSNKVVEVLWWRDFLDEKYSEKVKLLESKLRTRSAKKYLRNTIPGDRSILVVKKFYKPGSDFTKHASERKTYLISDVKRLAMNDPDRFTDTTPEMRYRTFKHDDFTCTKCHKTGSDVDLHVMETDDGLVTVCSECFDKYN